MIFDSKMIFEKHFAWVSRAASQTLGVLKYFRVVNERSFLERCFRCFVLYCSAVWCFPADTHLKILDPIVIGAGFITRGVLECNIAHR